MKEDDKDLQGELALEVRGLRTAVETRLDQVDERISTFETDWRNDLSNLQETVKGGGFDKNNAETVVKEILAKQRDWMQTQPRVGAADVVRIPNTWDEKADPGSIFTKDLADPVACIKSGEKGLERIIAMEPINENHRNLQRLAFDVWIMAALKRSSQGGAFRGLERELPKTAHLWREAWKAFGAEVKADADAMDTVDVANWVPTGWSAEIFELIKLNLNVAGLFRRFMMPTKSYDLPVNLTDTIGHLIAEQTDIVADSADTNTQVFNDAKKTFTAKKLRSYMVLSGELEEDAVLPMLPLIRNQTAMILANSQETATINGDSAGTHQDSDSDTATDPRKAFLGLRAFAIDASATVSAGGDALADGDCEALQKKMLEYGVDPTQLALIAGPSVYIQMLGLTNVATVDKYGPSATIVSGNLARWRGIPVVVSRYAREDLNASGIYDGTTTTLAALLAVNRNAWLYGDRRRVTVETERVLPSDQWRVVAFQRLDFGNLYGTSYATTAMLYNILT